MINLNLILILVTFVLCIYLINIYYNNNIKDTFVADPPVLVLHDLYKQRNSEINDINKVLERPIIKGDLYIEKLQPIDLNYDDYSRYVYTAKMDETKVEYLNLTEADNNLINKRKMNNTDVEFRDGGLYYWDKYYPKQMILVDFALNPAKYIKEHGNSYPSYLINDITKELINYYDDTKVENADFTNDNYNELTFNY